MTPHEIHLRALDVLDAAMVKRPEPVELLEQLRGDLEVLSRDDLIRVLVATGVEASLVIGGSGRRRAQDRLWQRRAKTMWEAS